MPEPEKKPDGPTLRDEVAAALSDEQKETPDSGTVPLSQARSSQPLRSKVTARNNVRLLFVTSDDSVLTPGTPAAQWYADLAQFVGEIHIMLVTTGRATVRTERPMRNVWLYHVVGRHVLEQAWETRRMARQQLRFNGMVRPDIVVATDPLVAGLSAWLVARTLERPWQLHIRENIFSEDWKPRTKNRSRALRLARFVIKRAKSVRVQTEELKTATTKHTRRSADIDVLPQLFNIEAFRGAHVTDVHEQYPQYAFIMLTEGVYSADSPLHDVFSATHQLLKNRRVGLIVRGHGSAKQLFIEKVKLLGVAEQVVFTDASSDPVSAYKTADVFIEAGTKSDTDEHVLRAIAASTAVVTYGNDFRKGFITDGESGFVCEPGDSYALGQKVRLLLNDTGLRKQFSERASRIASEQLHEDVPTYFKAYRDTITTVLVESE